MESCDFGFIFQAEDGIRELVRSSGLGDVYKRQQANYRFDLTWALPELGDTSNVGHVHTGSISATLLSLIHI